MPTVNPGYNERAWAIDVISEINNYCAQLQRVVARAGGEYTLTSQSGNLFPDVLLFGDVGGTVVLQGWELKMPDTAISDSALLRNAELKARRLGLDSFVVWNATLASLYVRNAENCFEWAMAWPSSTIKTRIDVQGNRAVWVAQLRQMIDDINNFLDAGNLSGAKPAVAIGDRLFVDFLQRFVSPLSEAIAAGYKKDAAFAAALDSWWSANEIEHAASSKFEGLARVNIVNWINRFLFAHYLKRFHNPAKSVEKIGGSTTIAEGISTFEEISAKCDFMSVFRPSPGQAFIDKYTWNALLALNAFLTDFRLESISQESFHQILESALSYSRKKLAGQFSTPGQLAELLVRITVVDRTLDVIDPCCGTGTIARAAYDLKRSLGIDVRDALRTVWGSDKFAFPLQLCSIALSDPLGMGEVIQVFREDAFNLQPGSAVTFTDPNTGGNIVRFFPAAHSIVSNLPFVRFEDKEKINPLINTAQQALAKYGGDKSTLSAKADLYAHLIVHMRGLVDARGRIGVITSNSWLATDWGVQFKQILREFFKVIRVVISAQGRWFKNAAVVTTIIVLERRDASSLTSDDEVTDFVTTKEDLEKWNQLPGGVAGLANAVLNKSPAIESMSKQSYSQIQIAQLECVGIGWSALFVELTWLQSLKSHLIPVSKHFDISRGERRGWDKLFYPKGNHGIESQYISPVLLSSKAIGGLIAEADGEAFCCSETTEIMKAQKKTGALGWIKKFHNEKNGSGKPLPNVLARAGQHWYEMHPSTLADLVITMNPDRRLAVHRMQKRAFVNQRLIRLTAMLDAQPDIDLLHALLNSAVGMFLIEAAGFGRGLGALDLNATKLSNTLHVLDPAGVNTQHRKIILEKFIPLLKRPTYELPDELGASDRIAFDDAVLAAFALGNCRETIYASLLALFHIRQTAKP